MQKILKLHQTYGWLQEFARLVARNGKSMCWTTPSGFYVKQDYPQLEDRRVKTKIGDSIIAVTTNVGPGQTRRKHKLNCCKLHSFTCCSSFTYICKHCS